MIKKVLGGVSGSSGNTIKGAVAIKRNAAETIETSVPDKGCTLCCDVNQPEPPATGSIIAAGRAVKYGIRRRDDIDHSSHTKSAVREAEVIIAAGLVKSVLVHRPKVGKDSLVAVRIVRRTKLFIRRAGIAAGDTVAVLGPCLAHRVAHEDVDRVRHKHIATLPHCHIENLTAARWDAAHCWPAVLIYNMDCVSGGLFLLVARFSSREKYHRKRRRQQTSKSYGCI